ncbi:MAG: chromate transporter [Oligosphaeraceae bacterium]|nr:chromate transporter [Oligosphaeraceae bacterium]
MSDKNSRLYALFKIFFYVSAVTLGGGLAMLPLLRCEFVQRRQWLSDADMIDTVALMQAMPGIIAMNMGVLLGYRVAGVAGAVAAVIGGFMPPFLAIVLLATLIMSLQDSALLNHAFLGVRAGVCALILLAVIELGKQILKSRFEWVLASACFIAAIFFNVNAIWLIVLGILAGLGRHAWQSLNLARQHTAGTDK